MAEKTNDKTILVVDDDPAACDLMSTVLAKANYQVLSTFHSRETLTYLKQGAYLKVDLVITDLEMPGYGGYSIIKDLQSGIYEQVPVLVVTGRKLDDDTIRMIEGEPNVKGLLRKPLSVTSFLGKVNGILGVNPATQPAQETQAEAENP